MRPRPLAPASAAFGRASTRRDRAYPVMIAPDEALRLVVEAACPRPARRVPLAVACGLRLAEEVRADRDYPPFPRAMMDGYAVSAADAGRTAAVCGELQAGNASAPDASGLRVAPGRCVEIMTGASCPAGTEAVVPREYVRREGDVVALPPRIQAGENIAPRASECPAGRVVMRPGQTITPLGIAALASFGLERVLVAPRPTMAVITTGGELVPPGQTPLSGQIRDSNGPMLAAMAMQAGLAPPPHWHAQDTLPAIGEILTRAAGFDVVLLSGGVSAGNYDFVPRAVEECGAEIVFHKVVQKPGKPLLFARRGEQLLFGLPGNPLACHLGFSRYVAAALRKMLGQTPMPEQLQGRLAAPIRYEGKRWYFLLARAERAAVGDVPWLVAPCGGVSSADIFAPSGANCYVSVPAGTAELTAGTVVRFTWAVPPGMES